jgi:RHS repeat-associated protein
LGRRESKTIGGTATNFLYDGLNLEQELNGTTPTVNYLTGVNIDEVFSRSTSGGTQSYLTDNLGSTLALTSSAGAIQTSYTYEPYGNTTVSGASSTNALQYTGRENDGDGLYYYRARHYSPEYGRFISNDPIGFLGGINEYSYALSNPTNHRDPVGLYPSTNDFGNALAGTFNLGTVQDLQMVGPAISAYNNNAVWQTFGSNPTSGCDIGCMQMDQYIQLWMDVPEYAVLADSGIGVIEEPTAINAFEFMGHAAADYFIWQLKEQLMLNVNSLLNPCESNSKTSS